MSRPNQIRRSSLPSWSTEPARVNAQHLNLPLVPGSFLSIAILRLLLTNAPIYPTSALCIIIRSKKAMATTSTPPERRAHYTQRMPPRDVFLLTKHAGGRHPLASLPNITNATLLSFNNYKDLDNPRSRALPQSSSISSMIRYTLPGKHWGRPDSPVELSVECPDTTFNNYLSPHFDTYLYPTSLGNMTT
jgi:hypothetical protein